jgi:hypothetical protein
MWGTSNKEHHREVLCSGRGEMARRRWLADRQICRVLTCEWKEERAPVIVYFNKSGAMK